MNLQEVYDRIEADPFWDHLRLPGIRLVPGFGQSPTGVLIVGEAPGASENTRLRPFCGASGQVLEQLAASAGLYWREVPPEDDGQEPAQPVGTIPNCFITNVVKYRPMGNRTPDMSEIFHAQDALREEWAAVGSPRVVVAVGNSAQAALGCGSPDPRGLPMHRSGTTFWPMYHPAFAMRHKAIRSEVERHWEELGEWLRSK